MRNVALSCVVAWLAFAWPLVSLGQQQAPRRSPAVIEAQVKVVEVDLAALRRLGVDWNLSKEKWSEIAKEQPAELAALIDGMTAAKCVHVQFRPTIQTVTGRQASLQVGTSRFNILPKVLDDGAITGDVRVEIEAPMSSGKPGIPDGKRRFGVSMAVTAKSGETVCLCHPGNMRCSLEGNEEGVVFCFLTMTKKTADEVNAAIGVRAANTQPTAVAAPRDASPPRR